MSLPPDLVREDIGHGVWMHKVTGGIIVGHVHEDGSECCGSVLFDVPAMEHLKRTGRPLWSVVQEEPLTITPSIHAPDCGLHGYITEGKWVPV